MKPNCFVIGYERTGTTLLYNILSNSDKISLPFRKEPHYFDYNIKKGEKWYLNYFSDLKKEIICDITPNYINVNNIANIILEYNKKSSVIIIIRNPIKLIESMYLHDIKTLKTEDSFEKFWNKNKNKVLFYEKLKSFGSIFKKEKLLICVFEENIKDFSSYINKLSNFLDITIPIDNKILKKTNDSYAPKYKMIHRLGYFLFDKFVRNNQNKFLIKIKNKFVNSYKNNSFFVSKKIKNKNVISSKLISEMHNYYIKDIVKVSELLNKDLLKIWNFNSYNKND